MRRLALALLVLAAQGVAIPGIAADPEPGDLPSRLFHAIEASAAARRLHAETEIDGESLSIEDYVAPDRLRFRTMADSSTTPLSAPPLPSELIVVGERMFVDSGNPSGTFASCAASPGMAQSFGVRWMLARLAGEGTAKKVSSSGAHTRYLGRMRGPTVLEVAVDISGGRVRTVETRAIGAHTRTVTKLSYGEATVAAPPADRVVESATCSWFGPSPEGSPYSGAAYSGTAFGTTSAVPGP